MARQDEITAQDILAHLARARTPARLRDIAQGLGLRHHSRRALPRLIAQLKHRGEIEELRGGRYRLAGVKRPADEPHRAEAPQGRQAQPVRVSRTMRDPNLITGRLVTHRDGYGFVVPEHPVPGMEGDLFIGRDRLGDAMHSDLVLARIERPSRAGMGGRAEGRILRVLERAHPTVVGLFRYGDRGNVVLPYDPRLLHEIVVPPGEELTPELRAKLGQRPSSSRRARLPELDGAVVNVELTRFPRGGVAPAGRVVEILGRPGDFGVDVEIILRKHYLPFQFPKDVLAEARRAAQPVREGELAGRQDFRHLPIVTIDGETAKDFDDAVYVAQLADGRRQLQVHIADVAHYVPRDSALDREARLRGTSVYFPDRAIPMLPEELSNGICSLKPQEDRLVMSALMEIDSSGKVLETTFTPGVIQSVERMTYINVNKVLEGDAEANRRYARLAGEFQRMRELALLLNARRARRGSIDFDLPEPVIEFDELGRMVKIVRSERNIAHRIIEEFMLAANEAVAAYLDRRGIASLHRVHEKPDAKKVLEFEEIAKTFGYSLGVAELAERRVVVKHGRVPALARAGRAARGRERQMIAVLPGTMELDIRPQHYQRLAQKIAGKPEERILSYLMLRSLKQARYAADPLGHFALAFDHYTHFTSPIRRYPDLIVHRILKWALAHPESRSKPAAARKCAQDSARAELGPYPRLVLEEIAEESSEAERRADGAERELMDWKTAQFMESHLGEEYDALIISVQKFGFFVELLEIFVEGLVPITTLEDLTGERCFYRERDHSIVAQRGRRQWRLGDRVRVRADRIDPMRRRVEFSVVS
ncbi:MAG TPA: VacB/RNase II family 3'-5' exoribonuclease [Candidatus Acidoferrales bacterium]|nr:VacB/RNase II family 3'-5' exoribonuclease [Candidatus Acidoferrales bacterium]